VTHDESTEYVARASGVAGYEILADGEVVAWTVDGWWAAIIVDLLNEKASRRHGVPEPA
jgi:hypothetical protein